MTHGVDSERQVAWKQQQREREARWREHLGAWRSSRLSQAEYCRQHSLAPGDFSWWKREVARRDRRRAAGPGRAPAAGAPQFVPLTMTLDPLAHGRVPGAQAAVCEVLLGNGRRVRIGCGAPVQWVADLAAALERPVPC